MCWVYIPLPTRSRPSSLRPFSSRQQIHSSMTEEIFRPVASRCWSSGVLKTILLLVSVKWDRNTVRRTFENFNKLKGVFADAVCKNFTMNVRSKSFVKSKRIKTFTICIQLILKAREVQTISNSLCWKLIVYLGSHQWAFQLIRFSFHKNSKCKTYSSVISSRP